MVSGYVKNCVFYDKSMNLVHGQISNKQTFWEFVPRQKCTLTAANLNFKMATCFHVKPVKLDIILQYMIR